SAKPRWTAGSGPAASCRRRSWLPSPPPSPRDSSRGPRRKLRPEGPGRRPGLLAPSGRTGALRMREATRRRYRLTLRGREVVLGERTWVMGVLNVTPDSFSDGGFHYDRNAALAWGLALFEAGADVVDVGGESTRPGSAPVDADEECRRVV